MQCFGQRRKFQAQVGMMLPYWPRTRVKAAIPDYKEDVLPPCFDPIFQEQLDLNRSYGLKALMQAVRPDCEQFIFPLSMFYCCHFFVFLFQLFDLRSLAYSHLQLLKD